MLERNTPIKDTGTKNCLSNAKLYFWPEGCQHAHGKTSTIIKSIVHFVIAGVKLARRHCKDCRRPLHSGSSEHFIEMVGSLTGHIQSRSHLTLLCKLTLAHSLFTSLAMVLSSGATASVEGCLAFVIDLLKMVTFSPNEI
jgi:hypothetical protein